MNDRMFKVTVVIVTYQSKKTIKFTLDALEKAYNLGLADVVVVDNASIDGTAVIIEKKYPWVTLVRKTRNVGFGKGCNSGFKYVKTPYLMFLNPDAVIDIQSLRTLINFMDQYPRAGMCGPAIKEPSGEMPSIGSLPTPWNIIFTPLFARWTSRGRRYVFPGEAPAITEWICGACMFLRKDMFENIGGFDPRFFLYFEETDLCLRIQQSGWEIWTVGEAICEHVNAASAKETKAHMIGDTIPEHFFRSRFYYIIKHFGLFWAILAEIGEIVFISLKAVFDLLRGRLNKSLLSRFQEPIMKLPSRIDDTEWED
jgi:N-acetylglucosaminyl-diphospho-decaprenol L-rhamnosyltransferase